MITSLK